MYSQDKINIALQAYYQCGAVMESVRVLGYPTRRALYTWVENEGVPKSHRKELTNINTAEHPRNPSIEVKMNALHRCFKRGGTVSLINDKNIQPDTLMEGNAIAPATENEQMQEQMQDMQLEIDLLKETINILKKDPGIDQTDLRNSEKTVIVDVLKDRHSLSVLLERISLSKGSYYDQKFSLQQEDKYYDIRKKITKLFFKTKDVTDTAESMDC